MDLGTKSGTPLAEPLQYDWVDAEYRASRVPLSDEEADPEDGGDYLEDTDYDDVYPELDFEDDDEDLDFEETEYYEEEDESIEDEFGGDPEPGY